MKRFYVCILVSLLFTSCASFRIAAIKENSYELDRPGHAIYVTQMNTLEVLGVPESLIIEQYGFNPFYKVKSYGNGNMSAAYVENLAINGVCNFAYSKGYKYVAISDTKDNQNISTWTNLGPYGGTNVSIKHNASIIAFLIPNNWCENDTDFYNKIREEGLSKCRIIETKQYASEEIIETFPSL